MNKIPLFFHIDQACDAGSFSQSPIKSLPLFNAWQERGLTEHHVSGMASRSTIALAHDPKYVADVLGQRINNGFGNRRIEVARALPYQVGSLVDACMYVAASKDRAPVACSPTSGFHHANFDHGDGYCTFNGLVIAAQSMVLHGMANRVGILDCDFHYGDGTDSIIKGMGLIHEHWTAGRHYNNPAHAKEFLRGLSTVVKSFKGVGLLIYQAGADQHINDPLGGMLTTEQMAERDRTVFWTCREYRIPLVWNLAGGYQTDAAGTIQPVLDLHHQTMQQCVDIYVHEKGRKP